MFNWCLEKHFLIKLLNIVYLIKMAAPWDALTSIINSSYIYKIYYFTIPEWLFLHSIHSKLVHEKYLGHDRFAVWLCMTAN